ncbi:hypothetical protein BAAM0483_01325 [Bifidobacterium animalis subsp. animalis MCC 0483]|uniref:Transposase n=1 Tax=Bifidobacterium animalis subsp. animalis MCC 0483 TaxID=1365955 RepID=A0AB34TBR1_9BIFI|nr:hypothetical protein [Bifidobacterium animalis]KOA51640.1 hypothetical protein BAAM0483_01325 [Bifidobacterium animalis subsp. animalis MCC 0483]
MPNQNQQPQPVQIPMELVLDELRQENARLSYDLAVARAQIKVMQAQTVGGESNGGDTEPAE